ncbi:MAG: biotin/lipoyl-binding protein [Rhizobiaceae bacterium]
MMYVSKSGRLIALLFLTFIFNGCDEAGPPEAVEIIRPVRTIEVTDLSELHNRYFIGSARAAKEVSLAFRVPGTVTNISVVVGDEVDQGQVLGTLDPAPYQAEG